MRYGCSLWWRRGLSKPWRWRSQCLGKRIWWTIFLKSTSTSCHKKSTTSCLCLDPLGSWTHQRRTQSHYRNSWPLLSSCFWTLCTLHRHCRRLLCRWWIQSNVHSLWIVLWQRTQPIYCENQNNQQGNDIFQHLYLKILAISNQRNQAWDISHRKISHRYSWLRRTHKELASFQVELDQKSRQWPWIPHPKLSIKKGLLSAKDQAWCPTWNEYRCHHLGRALVLPKSELFTMGLMPSRCLDPHSKGWSSSCCKCS